MPEFILQGKESPRFQELDEFTQGYIEAMFFTDSGPDFEEDDMDDVGFYDLAPQAVQHIQTDCKTFCFHFSSLFRDNLRQAGMDFWYSRNGHGIGFRDRPEIYGKEIAEKLDETCGTAGFKECYVYRGDDGKVYVQ